MSQPAPAAQADDQRHHAGRRAASSASPWKWIGPNPRRNWVLYQDEPQFFGAKPKMVIKGGMIGWANMVTQRICA